MWISIENRGRSLLEESMNFLLGKIEGWMYGDFQSSIGNVIFEK